ncbi:MAG TPA: hypothetical protein VJR29_01865 [bacterium]|nr:hypothetical protein [bacterium]
MHQIFTLSFAILLFIPVSLAWAQPKDKSAVEVGTTPTPGESEAQVQRGLPEFMQGIQNAVTALKKNDFEGAQASLAPVRKTYGDVMNTLKKISGDEERELGLQRIGQALDEANYALEARRKKEALDQLTQAYRLTKTLSQSPVLKLTATKVALYNANRDIQNKNYTAAGDSLGRAIDNITAVENDPGVNQQELSSLKSSIVIAHQQIVLGKQADGTYMSKLYQRATAATSNALYQYYDMWTRTAVPWELNE